MRLAAALALMAAAAPHAGAEVRAGSFESRALARSVEYLVHLPPSYAASSRRFPVVYVLHGLFESHAFWERRGLAPQVEALWRSGALPEMVFVAPNGGNSFFANTVYGRYEDLVTRDLPAHVESAYRVRPGPEGRGLLGISMGGYGALRIALARPEFARAVAAHSAMLLEKIPSAADGAGRWHMSAFHAVFGEPIDPALWSAHDPLALAARADPARAPALRFDCGAQDRFGLFAGNRALHQRLEARGVRHEFALPPGDHGYEYVRSVLPESLAFLARALAGR